MWWQQQKLAVGSGFIASQGSAKFLVTARHNLAGRRWPDNALLSKWGVDPDRVIVKMPVSEPDIPAWSDCELPLLDDDGFPLWYEHPQLGRRADLAALPLVDESTWVSDAFDVSTPAPDGEPMLSAGDDLFVVGFPLGFTPYIGTPIWTRASVASEPALPYDNLPMYLVDARTRVGHSGSAVVLRPGMNRSVRMRDGSTYTTSIDDAWIAGLYSGRVRIPGGSERGQQAGDALYVEPELDPDSGISSEAEVLDIGLVWRTGAILSTIEGRTRFPSKGDAPPRWETEAL